jgi:hypothetical protein
MSGLLRRLRRRRPATADETRAPTPGSSEPAGAPAETPAEPGGGQPVPAGDDQPTQMLPPTGDQPAVAGEPATTAAAATRPVVPRDLPAGVDPGQLEQAPTPSARRGKLRRRLRYLRRVRELLLRDLGGFIYEVHRTAGGTPHESHRRLATSKAARIAALDVEVRELESRLSQPHAEPLLREPGIGGTCPECGELYASDARYCARCGTPLDAKARASRDATIAAAAAAHPTTGSHAVTEPGPASVLWAAGPRPRAHAAGAADQEEPRPASVTSQWLARRDQPTVLGTPDEGAGEAPAAKDEPAAAKETAAEPVAPAAEPAPPPHADEAPAAKPKRAPRARKPAAEDAPAAAPKRATRPRRSDPKPAADDAEKNTGFSGNPNGRRDEDVPPPVPSGDPLGSRGEERT